MKKNSSNHHQTIDNVRSVVITNRRVDATPKKETSAAFLSFVAMLVLIVSERIWKRQQRTKRCQEKPYSSPLRRDTPKNIALKRKKEFLLRVGDQYGYRISKFGYIDEWRPKEFPRLQSPLDYDDKHSDDDYDEKEIYLDYAGSALPMKSQLEQAYHDNVTNILANPHSNGPAASRTLLKVNRVKRRILAHFSALPGRYASLRLPASFHNNNIKISPMDQHSGYDVVFTSGATEGFKMIAERFPWKSSSETIVTTSRRCSCSRRYGTSSILMYTTNAHNSVVGMRQLAMQQGATFYSCELEDLERMTAQDFRALEEKLTSASTTNNDSNLQSPCPECNDGYNPTKRHLLVFPSECNFGGNRPDAASIIAVARECGWYTMLDIAKAASTSIVHLRELDPDFAALSFYKLFGDPTGVGALLIKRSSIPVLFENDKLQYQGGGSVNVMLPSQDYTVPKSDSSSLESLTNGSIHFRGIVNLVYGFDTLEGLGGMSKIHLHANCIARELALRLRQLRHVNGLTAVRIYGAWGNLDVDDEEGDDEQKAQLLLSAGPTVTFNIVREDGSIVGYNEVSKLAALHRPPIQFRTGCFCNPGACQRALGLTDQQVINNFEKTGHVCGDHIDLANGLPTGAIRVSFGKDSLWEDMDVFVNFLEGTFVNGSIDVSVKTISNSDGNATTQSYSPAEVRVSELYIFPIKSCAAQRVSKWQLELPTGKLKYDREFALVDTSGTALRLQTCPKLGLLCPVVDPEKEIMTVSAPGCRDLVLILSEHLYHGGENVVQVCGNKCNGRVWGDAEVSQWFSTFLGIQCWLARYSQEHETPRNGQISMKASRHGFSNEQPILLISENAVAALNEVLAQQHQRPVGSKRFRPNIVVKAERKIDNLTCDQCERHRHIEDDWKTISLVQSDLKFKVEGSCPRCTMVDFDPTTGQKGRTLQALAKYRRKNGSIVFGIFLRALMMSQQELPNTVWIEEGDWLECR